MCFAHKLLPDQYFGIPAAQEVLNGLARFIVREFHVQNDAGVVLAKFFFFLITLATSASGQEAAP